jgi:hypothetical protein
MITRCENPNTNVAQHYIAKGIKVCPHWRESFESFLADVGEPPSEKHSLDRIDGDKSYEPGNVRWATKLEQSRNRACVRYMTFAGRTYHLTGWAAFFRINKATLHEMLAKRGEQGALQYYWDTKVGDTWAEAK